MPFKSKKQHRYFRYLESKGELPKGTSDKFMKHTKNYSNLPEKKEAAHCNSKLISNKKKVISKVAILKSISKIALNTLKQISIIKPIDIQKDEFDRINYKKRQGMTPVQYRNYKKLRY